jgi:hypothetical protein
MSFRISKTLRSFSEVEMNSELSFRDRRWGDHDYDYEHENENGLFLNSEL